MVRATTFKSVNAAAAWTSQMFVALATFGFHVAFSGEPLTAPKIFSCLACFQVMNNAISMVPRATEALAEAYVALTRLEDFMLYPEHFA
eukprot:SAG31_NODE_27653_length_422_cov_1.120743_1_plen_88_part_10